MQTDALTTNREEEMRKTIQWFTSVLLSFFAACACAQTVDMKALVAGMKQGGYVIVLRHGATNRDQADTDPLNPDNVSKQRHLSDAGKALAKQVGQRNTLLVTHKPNVIDAFGKDWFDVKEGEASVFQPGGAGKPVLIAR